MSDVKFDIEVTGIKELRDAADNFQRLGKVSSQLAAQYKPLGAQTNRLVKEQQRLDRVLKSLEKAESKKLIDQKELIRAYQEEVRVSKQRILTDKTLIDQAKKAAKAEEERKKKVQSLTRAYAPARVAADEYKRTIKEIRTAQKQGVITAEEMETALARVTREYKQFTAGVATGGNQFARFNVTAYNTAQTFKRQFNTGMQQAGYQVGDFFVQIQSGQSAMVALGQQGSQLAGIFGPKGAVVGGLLAIGTAAITMYQQTTQAFADVEEATNEIKTAFDELETITETLELSVLDNAEAFDGLSNSLKGFLGTIRLVKQERLQEALGAVSADLITTKRIGNRNTLRELGVDAPDAVRPSEFLSARRLRTGMTTEVGMVEGMGLYGPGQVKAANIIQEGLQGVTREDLAKNFITMTAELGEAGLLTTELAAKLEEVQNQLGISGIVNKLILEEQKALEKAAEQAEEDRLGLLADRGKAEQKLAEENAAYEAEQARMAEEDRIGLIEDRGRAEKALADENAAYEKKVAKEQEDRLKKAAAFHDTTLKALKDQNAELAIQINHYNNEKALKEKNRELERHRLEQQISANKLSSDQADNLREQLNRLHEQEDALDEILKKEKQRKENAEFLATYNPLDKQYNLQYSGELAVMGQAVTPSGKGGPKTTKSTGQSPQEKLKEYIKGLESQRNKEKSLVGVFDEQRDLMGSLIEARQEYSKIATESQMKTIEGYLRETHALEQQHKALEEARAQNAELTEMIVTNFGDAFLAIGEGTKSVEDAFREMAAEIIKELYRVLVVQKMVNAAKAFFFGFADGGVFSKGNVVPYAKGGVVGSPTYFPMSGGRTGLMGEAGPEAIMPLKRGKNGKLGVEASGQGDNITISQTFNFAANGDESVKRIIVKSMPQITEAAKAGVLDARKRGGSFRKVFS